MEANVALKSRAGTRGTAVQWGEQFCRRLHWPQDVRVLVDMHIMGQDFACLSTWGARAAASTVLAQWRIDSSRMSEFAIGPVSKTLPALLSVR